MKEIGGYIELDTYTGKMLHDEGIELRVVLIMILVL